MGTYFCISCNISIYKLFHRKESQSYNYEHEESFYSRLWAATTLFDFKFSRQLEQVYC